MSVLIKGMEMPRDRGEYELRLYVDSDGSATVEGAHRAFEGEPFEVVPVRRMDGLEIWTRRWEVIKMNRYINADELTMWIYKECLHNGTSLRIIDKISSMQYLQNPQIPCCLCTRWEKDMASPTKETAGLHKCRFLDIYTDKSFYCALGELRKEDKNE